MESPIFSSAIVSNIQFQSLRSFRKSSVRQGPSPLSRIEIPPSIEEIRLDCVVPAFTGFCSLTELAFPPGIVLRDLFGFTECPALSQIALPPSVERVNAFSNCRALREIHFSEAGALRELDGFANLPSLFQVTIPSSVEVIGKSGFGGCPSLTDVTFAQPSALSAIRGFNDCGLLSRIEIPSSVEEIEGFNRCRRLAHVTFAAPSGLRFIDGFAEWSSLRRIEIPARVTVIGRNAFRDALSLEEVIFVGESALREVRGPLRRGVRIEIPPQLGDAARRFFDLAFVWMRRTTPEWDLLVRMSDSVCLVDRARGDFSFVPRTISDDATFQITLISDSLLAVAPSGAIPPSIVEVRRGGSLPICLREVAIPNSIEIVGGFSGWGCLESVKFGTSGKLREIRGFRECSSLCRIEIPDSVELIGGFNECAALAEVTVAAHGQLRRIDGFCECGSLVRIDIPDSVELIDGFNGCMPFSEVRFAPLGRLRKITGFKGCGSLREVEIPRSVALIVNGFWNCEGLRKVTFAAGGHLQSLGGFKDCPLKEIVIPAGGRGRALRLNPRVYIAFEEEASIAELRRNSQMRPSRAGIV